MSYVPRAARRFGDSMFHIVRLHGKSLPMFKATNYVRELNLPLSSNALNIRAILLYLTEKMLCKGGLKKLSISKVAESFSASLCDITNQFSSSMRCIAVSDIAFNFLALFAPIKDRWTLLVSSQQRMHFFCNLCGACGCGCGMLLQIVTIIQRDMSHTIDTIPI